ncbi:MAG: ABC transporter permease [Amnibacterium sp.]
MARHNLRTVIGFEFTRTVSRRRFWIATLFVPALLVVVALLVTVSNSSTRASSDALRNARFTFAYTDASGIVDPAVAQRIGGRVATDPAAALADVKAGRLAAFFAYPAHPATETTRVYGVDKGVFTNGRYSSVAEQLLRVSATERIGSPQLSGIASSGIRTDTTTYQGGREAGGFGAVLPALLYLVLFYILIVLLGNQMLGSLLEEKENRVTEMILTTIDPNDLILGKVVSLFLIGLVQILVFAVPLAIGYTFFRSALNIPDLGLNGLQLDPERMIVGALLLLGGFALFVGTLVALGAAMPTVKDAGPIFGGLMVLIFVPFYIITLIVSDPSAPLVQLFTYFPYSAPITAMLRNAFGTLPLWQGLVVVVELFALAAIVLRVAAQIFRYGAIEYSRKVDLRTALSVRRGGRTQPRVSGPGVR